MKNHIWWIVACFMISSCGKSSDDPPTAQDDDDLSGGDDTDDPILTNDDNDDDEVIEESWSTYEDAINLCLSEGDWFARVEADPACLDYSQPVCEALIDCYPNAPGTMELAFHFQSISDILAYQHGCRCVNGVDDLQCTRTDDDYGSLTYLISCHPLATECDEAVYTQFKEEIWREFTIRGACSDRHFFVLHQCYAERECDTPFEVCNELEGGFGYYDGYNYCTEENWMYGYGPSGKPVTMPIQDPNLAEAIDAFIVKNGLTECRLFGADAMGCDLSLKH